MRVAAVRPCIRVDFLHASASAKIVNASTIRCAGMLFGLTGDVHWLLGLAMAACSKVFSASRVR